MAPALLGGVTTRSFPSLWGQPAFAVPRQQKYTVVWLQYVQLVPQYTHPPPPISPFSNAHWSHKKTMNLGVLLSSLA